MIGASIPTETFEANKWTGELKNIYGSNKNPIISSVN